MIHFAPIWALARGELALTRRLARYWVFVVIAALAGAWNFAWLHFIHRMFSGYSASAAALNPRFFLGSFGNNYLILFLAGILFLAFDLRARDQRERIVEVLDTRPCSNIELVLGKALGLLIAAWVPAAVITLALVGVSIFLGTSTEPRSILTLLVFMAIPAFVLGIGLFFTLSLILRHRLVVALAGLTVLTLAVVGAYRWVPLYAVTAWDMTGGFTMPFPSDVIPKVINGEGLLQRLAYLLAGLGLLLVAAAIHPRLDSGSRGSRAAVAAAVLFVAVGLLGFQVWRAHGLLDEKRAWREAHEHRRGEPAPDIVSLAGEVRIDPGGPLALDLTLDVRAPEHTALERALFTLNPGLLVSGIRSSSGAELKFVHQDGILDVSLDPPLSAGDRTSMRLSAAGEPVAHFSYLDAAFELLESDLAHAQVALLGYEPQVTESRYVALLPGTRWLPASGVETGRGDGRDRVADFFEIDLTVDVPEGWLVAGPGRRQAPREAAPSGRSRYRFAPGAVVPEVALVASRFESVSTEIDGIQLEALFLPGHAANFRFFEDAGSELRDWLTRRLEEADAVGLAYPYDAMTLVEVPMALRGYGGGWRMDSTLIQPAMVLLRESSFPTARFQSQSLSEDFEEARDEEGGVARAKRDAVLRFFENDVSGGNPFLAVARSYFGYQTRGFGREALPLDFVLENLSAKVITDRSGYFSAHFFTDPQSGQTFGEASMALNDQGAERVSDHYGEVFLHLLTSKPEVWDMALSRSLADLEPDKEPRVALNVLALKGGAMARSLLDALGREKAGRFLAALRSANAGRPYTREDVIAAGHAVGADLESWLQVWIEETKLPGFVATDTVYQHLADAPDGTPRYQLRAAVRNEEEPPGLVRIEYRIEGEDREIEGTEPVLVPGRSAVEIGLVTAAPLSWARVSPYLSLNRNPFALDLPTLDSEKIVAAEPFVGSRPVDWRAPATDIVVVDDLDPGFALEEQGERKLLRVAGKGGGEDEVLDQGLPVAQGGGAQVFGRSLRSGKGWSRMGTATAWGRYRRTMAVVGAGEGKRHAVFSTELPRAGRWSLEYYVPQSVAEGHRRPGTWNLVLADSSGTQPVTFDATAASAGWNALGTFEIAGGDVQVKISDGASGDFVIADAIRWTPASSTGGDLAAR